MPLLLRMILMLFVVLPLGGCTLAAWGITELTSRHRFIGTSRSYAKPMKDVVSTAETSLRTLGIEGIQKESEDKRVYLVGQTRVGEKVRVQIAAKDGVTQVTYRQGAFENDVAALAFFRKLDAELPAPPIEPVENDPPVKVTIDNVESLE